MVVITADHGEQFGEHGVFNHGFSLYAQEVDVPLLIISSRAPAGVSISQPVSLRNLATTIVDLCTSGPRRQFPGVSLAECWLANAGASGRRPSAAISEVDIPVVIGPERGHGPAQRGFTMSSVVDNLHYIVDIRGTEELYDLAADPAESHNLKDVRGHNEALDRLRRSLAEFLRDNRVKTGVAADYEKQLMKLIDTWLPLPAI